MEVKNVSIKYYIFKKVFLKDTLNIPQRPLSILILQEDTKRKQKNKLIILFLLINI